MRQSPPQPLKRRPRQRSTRHRRRETARPAVQLSSTPGHGARPRGRSRLRHCVLISRPGPPATAGIPDEVLDRRREAASFLGMAPISSIVMERGQRGQPMWAAAVSRSRPSPGIIDRPSRRHPQGQQGAAGAAGKGARRLRGRRRPHGATDQELAGELKPADACVFRSAHGRSLSYKARAWHVMVRQRRNSEQPTRHSWFSAAAVKRAVLLRNSLPNGSCCGPLAPSAGTSLTAADRPAACLFFAWEQGTIPYKPFQRPDVL